MWRAARQLIGEFAYLHFRAEQGLTLSPQFAAPIHGRTVRAAGRTTS
jgi:hypothetical protein